MSSTRFSIFRFSLLLLLLLQTINAGWVSDKWKSTRDAALEKTQYATAAIEAATGEVVAEASSALNSAGELLTQKQAEAKEVATQLSAFADSARKPPSDAVKKMLTEDGFTNDDPEASCTKTNTAIRCIVWNFAITLDMGNHSATDAVGLRVSIKTPGLPAYEQTLKEAETMVPVPGFAADVKSPLDVSNSLAKLGVFLRFRVANGTDGGLDVNAGVTACASVALTRFSWAEMGGCLPVEPVFTITNGQIVVAAKIATLVSVELASGGSAGLAVAAMGDLIIYDLLRPGSVTKERGSLAPGTMWSGLWKKFGDLDDDESGAIDAGKFQDIAADLKEPLPNTELEPVHQEYRQGLLGHGELRQCLAA